VNRATPASPAVILQGGAMLGPGFVGSAFVFASLSSSWAEVAFPECFSLGGQQGFTIEFWANSLVSPPTFGFVASSLANSPISSTATSLTFGNGLISSTLPALSIPGTWTHYALIGRNGIVTSYVNGVATTTGFFLFPASEAFSAARVFALGQSGFFGSFLQGAIDEFTVYSQALSVQDITSIVSSGSAGKCISVDPKCPPATLACVCTAISCLVSVPYAVSAGVTLTIDSGTQYSFSCNVVFDALSATNVNILQFPVSQPFINVGRVAQLGGNLTISLLGGAQLPFELTSLEVVNSSSLNSSSWSNVRSGFSSASDCPVNATPTYSASLSTVLLTGGSCGSLSIGATIGICVATIVVSIVVTVVTIILCRKKEIARKKSSFEAKRLAMLGV
jgi:hypothetical protein